MSLQEDLNRVRNLRASKIPAHTRQVALLNGVESLLKEENQELNATAYFAALLSLLSRPDAAEPATELLAYIVPHVHKPLLASKIDVTISKLLPILLEDASTAHTRSAIAVLEAILISVDHTAWQVPLSELGAQRTLSGVLALAQDSRPKIRKRAIEAVQNILAEGQGGYKLAFDAAFTATSAASSVANNTQKIVHSLQLLKAVVAASGERLSKSQVDELFELILRSVRNADQYAVLTAFDVLNALPPNSQNVATLLTLKPAVHDKQLAPAWLALIAQQATNILDVIFTVTEYLTSQQREIVESAGQCIIALISEAFDPEDIGVARTLATDAFFPLLQVRYHSAWPTVCEVCAAFIAVLPFALAPKIDGVLNIVRVVGALRTSANEADVVLSAAIRVLGPHVVLELVPLQLDPVSGNGRAWLLPLLAESVQHTEIAYYFDELVPLANDFEEAAAEAPDSRRGKILATVSDQLLGLFARFCDECVDQMTRDQLQLVLGWLYSRPGMRPMICQGLKLFVETGSDTTAFVKEFGADILKSLLNVFQSMPVDSRGYVLETVDAYLAVLPKDEVTQLFNQISTLLAQSLADAVTSHTMMDITIAIAPYLTSDTAEIFFNLFKTTVSLPDALMQKKAYRALTNFKAGIPSSVLGPALLELQPSVLPNARRTRLQALSLVVADIPEDGDFSFVFRTLPEAILGTKDPNEKTREAAFSLVVLMGERMKNSSGFVDHAAIPEIGDDLKPPVSIVEYFDMIMAGLAGDTQHMVAATATALARVLFEFHTDIPEQKLEEYIELVYMLLESPSREIVTATLGFVKVSVLIMPQEQLMRHLGPLLNLLLAWSNEHKNHFKSKVRHLVERLLRRCGYEALEAVFPEKDKKLLHNIHKSKERARRKRSQPQEAGEEKQPDQQHSQASGRKFDNEFDEALYGSESEAESDDDAESEEEDKRPKGKTPRSEQFILGGDDPLDLLDERALSKISSSKPQAQPERKMKHKLAQTKDGRLIIGRDEEGERDAATENALKAYMEAVKSGPVRSQSGKLKYKRGKRAEKEDDDDEPVKPKAKSDKVSKQGKPGIKKHMQKRRRL